MWHVIRNLPLFHTSRLFIGYNYPQQQPNVSNTGVKVMTLILKVLQRPIKFIQCHLAEVTEVNFKTSACFFTFYRPNTECFLFSLQKCRMSREFCCLFTESWPDSHEFQAPVRVPCLKFWSPVGKSQVPLVTRCPLGSSLASTDFHFVSFCKLLSY